ncbi:MAG: hypothetical protein R2824_13015 [Saprospiraceae bacterium]|nr:hypothetical protein [Lewinella sp.]
MKKETENRIWAYLDGSCTAEERLQVEQLLESDPSFREEFRKSEILHRELRQMEVEIPSMRFIQNVMDKLPPVQQLATVPLVSPKWLKGFGLTFMSLILVFWGSSALMMSDNGELSQDTTEMVSLLEWMAQLTAKGISGPYLLAGIIFISIICLFFLDKWLQARFGRLQHR